MAQKAEYIRVFPGDVVKISGLHASLDVPSAVVLEVQPRYGCINGGTAYSAPLIAYQSTGSSEKHYCDNGYVAEVLQRITGRAAWRAPINIFQGGKHFIERPQRGLVVGYLSDLIMHELGRLRLHLPHPLDEEKVDSLFRAQHPGLVEREGFGFIRVHQKPFSRWVRKNAHRLCKNKKQVGAEKTRYNQSMEADYEVDMLGEMDTDDDLSHDQWREDPPDGNYFWDY